MAIEKGNININKDEEQRMANKIADNKTTDTKLKDEPILRDGVNLKTMQNFAMSILEKTGMTTGKFTTERGRAHRMPGDTVIDKSKND